MHTQAAFSTLALQWGMQNDCGSGSVLSKTNALAQIAIEKDPGVNTPLGRRDLSHAIIELAITAPDHTKHRNQSVWTKLVAGLRMDSFEIIEESEAIEETDLWEDPKTKTILVLRRMLPQDLPELNIREAENELVALLRDHNFQTATGHLNQAISNFSTGNWAAANAQFRTFYEEYLNEIAVKLGCSLSESAKSKRRYLGELDPPFLLSKYNEWDNNDNKPQYIQGLMSRMHPEGSHPGLSEEEDCTFRMQITLITARLFLRRFDQRKT